MVKRNKKTTSSSKVKRPKAIPIKSVKKLLHEDWSRKVRDRDSNTCQLCGSDEGSISAHHWYRTEHRGGRSRYLVENGVALCYGCHIHVVHKDADYYMVSRLKRYVQSLYDYDICEYLDKNLDKLTDSQRRSLAYENGLIDKVGNTYVRKKKSTRKVVSTES